MNIRKLGVTETYKLIYFNIRGLGEPIRLIFQCLEIPYEDHRINCKDWPDLQKNHKWGQVPELHIDGKTMLTQAACISRYLARKFDLMPSDILDATRCDEIVDAVQDLRIRTKPYILSKYVLFDGRDSELKKQLLEQDFSVFIPNIDSILLETQKRSNHEGHFIFGNHISWADFWLAHFTSFWEESLEENDLLKPYPRLKLQQEAVMNIPQIKKWIEQRPKTSM